MNRKKVKINFCGFWSSFNKQQNLFTIVLSKHFDVEISDNPDFVICSNRGTPFEYMKYDCVRIMFVGEALSPDFTAFDYWIGFDFLNFGDRYFRLPFGFFFNDAQPWSPKRIEKDEAYEILKGKKYFCNFIYGVQSVHGMREVLLSKLSKYKTVVSPGSFLNNTTGSTKRCSWQEKYEYLKESKFTIAGDSISYPGFFTEKIIHPFQNYSIPIYSGNPLIEMDFNKDSFIHCKDFSDIDRVIEQVKFLDKNDDAYVEMLLSQPLVQKDYLSSVYSELECFLVNIFRQNVEQAYRRVGHICPGYHESYLCDYMRRYNKTPEILRKLKEKIGKR